jgi:hypothetical protein
MRGGEDLATGAKREPMVRREIVLSMCVWIGSLGGAMAAETCLPGQGDEPKTLILALDGVPYRSVLAARELGAFEDWGEPRPMVSPFPSMTNVGFAAILSPFGAEAIPGYELRRYDPQSDRVVGGGMLDTKFSWREVFDLQLDSWWAKVGLYMTPRRHAMQEMRRLTQFVLDSPDELILALVSSTDSLTHFQGDAAIVRTLLDLSDDIEELRRLHRQLHGRDLRLVMLSDHGNAPHKVRRPSGIDKILRRAGLRPAKRLDRPENVVAVTFGVVGYGALYCDESQAEVAARAMLEHHGVHLAAFREDPNRVRVVSAEGEAVVLRRESPSGELFAYRPVGGDPLDLLDELGLMEAVGVVDSQGFASRDAWFEWTAHSRYPDAATRLYDSLNGVWVSNAASVIFSFQPGYAWGIKAAEIGAWLRAGLLEETHGSLDRDSTWGFYITSDADPISASAVRADRVLEPWAERSRCTSAALVRVGRGGPLHDEPRVVLPR